MEKDTRLRFAIETAALVRRGKYVTLTDKAKAIETLRVSEGWTWAQAATVFFPR